MGNNFIKQLILGLSLTFLIFAQDPQVTKISHETHTIKLPSVSELTKFTAVIAGNNSIAQLRGFFVIDGELIESHSDIGKLNSNEMMEYTFFIPAPRYLLEYQFFGQSTSTIAVSPKFSSRRQCIEDFNIKDNVEGNETLINERKKAKKLEHQVKLLEQSLLSAEYLAREIK